MTRPAQRLGRGLATLFNDAAPTNAIVNELPVTQMIPGPFQPRSEITAQSLTELTASIQAQGVLQPILVRAHPDQPGIYQIVAGERRWRAAQAAGLHTVPVHLRSLTDREAVSAALVENLQRHDLDVIEEAEGFQRLVSEFGMSHETLGHLIGKSRSHIANTVRLLQLPIGVRAQVKTGALTAGHARALLGHADPEKTADLVITQGLNVRQTEALVRRPDPVPAPAVDRNPDHDGAELEQTLTAYLGLRVRISRQGDRGTVHLSFTSFDQLDGLIRLLQP